MPFIEKKLQKILISGKMVWPIIEGGKGIAASDGTTAGHMALAGAVGTLSVISRKQYNELEIKMSRNMRHDKFVQDSIEYTIEQLKIAKKISNGNGRIHINILWELGGAKQILHGVLKEASHLVDGITCGAGLPYELADIASQYNVYYYPIVSSDRAFKVLWKKSYSKNYKMLGGVVYEDPWLAGGHNGLSNKEDPNIEQAPYDRVKALRKLMNEYSLNETPIVMAGGVWKISEWENWIDNEDIGKIAFQLGTRTLLTKETSIPIDWQKKLTTLKKGDILLNKFSPTGFYSSAIKNSFLNELVDRNNRQVKFSPKASEEYPFEIKDSNNKIIFVSNEDSNNVITWQKQGYVDFMKTPDDTIIFVTNDSKKQIQIDQKNCIGCLSHCRFSSWSDKEEKKFSTGRKVDPRSYCISKTLMNVINGESVDNNLLFSGKYGYRFAEDPLYKNDNIPTVQELVDHIVAGD